MSRKPSKAEFDALAFGMGMALLPGILHGYLERQSCQTPADLTRLIIKRAYGEEWLERRDICRALAAAERLGPYVYPSWSLPTVRFEYEAYKPYRDAPGT